MKFALILAAAILAFSTAAEAKPAQAVNAPWAFSCSAAISEAQRSCEINQTIERNNAGNLERIVRVSVRVAPKDRKLIMMVNVPTGIFLPAGIKLTIDGVEFLPASLQTCSADGCFAGVPLDDAALTKLNTGKNLEVTFQSIQRKDVKISLSLMGFEKTLARVR